MIDTMTFSTKKTPVSTRTTRVKRTLVLIAVAAQSIVLAGLLAPKTASAQQPSAYSIPRPGQSFTGPQSVPPTPPAYGNTGSAYITPSYANPNAPGAFNGNSAVNGNSSSATPPSFSSPNYNAAPGGSLPAPVFNPQYPDTTNSFGPVAPYPPVMPRPTVREADLIIQGYPARTGRVMFGGAVNSDAGVTGQVTIDERNFDISRWPTSFQDLFSGTAFRGAGQTFRLEAMPGNLFQRYTAQFADPNLFGYLPISMSLSGFYFDRRFNDWDEGRLGGRLSFGYRITPDLSVSAGGGGQNVSITRATDPTLPQLAEVVGDNTLYNATVSLIHDTRNSPLQPSEGHFIRASYDQAFGDFEYGRFEGEYRKYWSIRERADGSGKQTLSFGTQLGFSGEDTPLFENFFAGGFATIRGFDFRGASPVVPSAGGLVEVGGRFQWLNTIEYMFPLTADDAFRGVAFVDFGTVEEDFEVKEENFRVAPGFGFRVAIPMLGPAPLAFDFAFPVMQSEFDNERMFSFYMSANR